MGGLGVLGLLVLGPWLARKVGRKLHKGEVPVGQGDCIDCMACVNVCPMGIDIRNGQQLACITCALCIDACNGVMGKMGWPGELITYDSLANMAARSRSATAWLPGAARCQRAQFFGRGGNQLAGAMPLIHQAFDQAQAFDLLGRVAAFPVGVTVRYGKSVAAFPHAEDVLGEPGVALDCGNVETWVIHICPEQMLDKPLTICLMMPILRTNVLFV